MGNFSHVGKGSLSYRLLPRILGAIFFTLIIAALVISTLIFLHQTMYLTLVSMVIAGVFVVILLFIYIIAYLEYSNLQYLIEQNSLYLKEGVLSVDTETIPFQKIRNASFTQTFLQRLYGVGNVIIDQDPETYTWESIDQKTAQTILEAVSERSNIQPIAVENISQAIPSNNS